MTCTLQDEQFPNLKTEKHSNRHPFSIHTFFKKDRWERDASTTGCLDLIPSSELIRIFIDLAAVRRWYCGQAIEWDTDTGLPFSLDTILTAL